MKYAAKKQLNLSNVQRLRAFRRKEEIKMKFFVDTADIGEINELNTAGLIDGVTTNPSLIKKAGRDFKEIIADIM